MSATDVSWAPPGGRYRQNDALAWKMWPLQLQQRGHACLVYMDIYRVDSPDFILLMDLPSTKL